MYQFAAAQETSTVKLASFFLSFQTKDAIGRVNKSGITSENVLNGYHFEIEDNHELSKDEKTSFYVFFQICYPCFNP